MTNLNQVILNGNLTKDVEVSYGQSGTAFGKFTIAVNKTVKSGEEFKTTASFFDVKVFGKTAEYNQRKLVKGANVTIVGELVQETWQDKQTGANRSKVVITAEKVFPGAVGKKSNEPSDGVPKSDSFQKDVSQSDFPEDLPF